MPSGDEGGELCSGQRAIRAKPIVIRRIATRGDACGGDTVDPTFEDVPVVVDEVVVAVVGKAKGSGEKRRRLCPAHRIVGTEPVVSRGVAPDGYTGGGDRFDAVLVDAVVVVDERALEEDGVCRRRGGEECDQRLR
jgi:hypothetical protein